MNENGQVLNFRIVPCDSREFMKPAFEQIWSTKNRNIKTLAVYTDNPKSDKAAILEVYPNSFEPPEILLVLFFLILIYNL